MAAGAALMANEHRVNPNTFCKTCGHGKFFHRDEFMLRTFKTELHCLRKDCDCKKFEDSHECLMVCLECGQGFKGDRGRDLCNKCKGEFEAGVKESERY